MVCNVWTVAAFTVHAMESHQVAIAITSLSPLIAEWYSIVQT